MKKRLFLFVVLLLAVSVARAQAPAWQWTTASAGMEDQSEIKRAVVDAEGNVIVLGELEAPEATFGATTLRRRTTFKDRTESFVAKLSAAGEWLWAVPLDGVLRRLEADVFLNAGICGVAVDGGGNIVVCGTYGDTLTLGAHTLLPIPPPPAWEGKGSPSNAFVASLDAAGRWRWALTCDPATTSHAVATGVAVDAAGYAYLLGYTFTKATFGGMLPPDAQPLTVEHQPSRQYECFVARVTPAGQWAWAMPLISHQPAPDSTYAWAMVEQMAFDRAGNAYVAGFFSGTLTLGATTLTSTRTTSIPSSPLQSIFVAKLSTAGRWRWAAQASHTIPAYNTYHGSHNIRGNNTAVNALAVGRGGRIFLGGRYEDGLLLIPQTRAAARHLPPPKEGSFVAALSPKGQWEWLRVAPDMHRPQVSPDECVSVAVDPTSGDVLATGFVRGATAFGPTTPIRRQRPMKTYIRTWFLVRFTAAGTGRQSIDQWGELDNENRNVFVSTMIVGPKGAVYAVGKLDNHCFVARLASLPPAGRARAPR